MACSQFCKAVNIKNFQLNHSYCCDYIACRIISTLVEWDCKKILTLLKSTYLILFEVEQKEERYKVYLKSRGKLYSFTHPNQK